MWIDAAYSWHRPDVLSPLFIDLNITLASLRFPHSQAPSTATALKPAIYWLFPHLQDSPLWNPQGLHTFYNFTMSFFVAVPEFDHVLVPASQPTSTCPYCGNRLHQTLQPTSVPVGGTSPSPYTTAFSSSSTALLPPRLPQYIITDPEIESYTQISDLGHLINPSKSFTLQSGKQNQSNKFALLKAIEKRSTKRDQMDSLTRRISWR